jgi:hypothetical protein
MSSNSLLSQNTNHFNIPLSRAYLYQNVHDYLQSQQRKCEQRLCMRDRAATFQQQFISVFRELLFLDAQLLISNWQVVVPISMPHNYPSFLLRYRRFHREATTITLLLTTYHMWKVLIHPILYWAPPFFPLCENSSWRNRHQSDKLWSPSFCDKFNGFDKRIDYSCNASPSSINKVTSHKRLMQTNKAWIHPIYNQIKRCRSLKMMISRKESKWSDDR